LQRTRVRGPAGVIYALICMVAMAACERKEEREARYLEHGTALLAEQDYAKAAVEFRNALQINPTGASAHYYLGLIAERQSNARDAYAQYAAASDQDPKNPDYALAAGKFALLGGDLEGARHRAETALALRPNSAEAHALKAAVLLKGAHLPEAEAELNAARALEPKNATAASVAVGIALKKDDRAAARAALEQGIAVNPDSEALLLLKVAMASEDKNLAAANEALDRLVAVQPGNAGYWLDLVRVAVLRNQPNAAEQAVRGGIAARPDDKNLRLLLVRLLAARGQPERAEQELRAAINANPDEPAYRLGIVSFYRAEGRLDDARAILKGLIGEDAGTANKVDAKLAYARLAIAGGDLATAQETVAELLAAEPRNADALVIRAGLAMTERKFDAAIADLRVVVQDQPRHGRALILLCSAYDATRQQGLALDCRRRYLAVNPAADTVRVDYARRLMQAGWSDAAATEIAQVLERDPTMLPARLTRIDQEISRGDWAAAEQDARTVLASGDAGRGQAALGRVFFAQKRYREAIDALVQARGSLSRDADILTLLVAAHLAIQDIDGAKSIAEAAVEDAPQDPAPRVVLADVAFSAGDPAKAESDLRTAISLGPDWNLPYLKLGSLLRTQNRVPDALVVFHAGLEKLPDDPDLLLKLALTEDLADMFDAAWNHYQALLRVLPESIVAANNIASLAADIWPQDKARLEQARRLTDRFRDTREPMLMDTLGWVQVRLGNSAYAVVLLQRAVAARPEDAQLRYHLGMAYLAQHDTAKARDTLAAAAATNQVYRGKAEAIRAFTELSSK
jgi:tetratricopeptide (TPR) repeat protein